MASYLATKPGDTAYIRPFEPRMWTTDFSRPTTAAITTLGPDALQLDSVFYYKNGFTGFIWQTADGFNHPLLRFQTRKDLRGHTLNFAWSSAGIEPLDSVTGGPTLTVQGRDANGAATAWYVPLTNYVTGVDPLGRSLITFDFDALYAGFTPDPAQKVYAGAVDRLLISTVPLGYDAGSSDLFPDPVEGWARMEAMAITGPPLARGRVMVPAHDMRIATSYEDSYNITPERMLENINLLGYRRLIDHYVGAGLFFRLLLQYGALRVYIASTDQLTIAGTPLRISDVPVVIQ